MRRKWFTVLLTVTLLTMTACQGTTGQIASQKEGSEVSAEGDSQTTNTIEGETTESSEPANTQLNETEFDNSQSESSEIEEKEPEADNRQRGVIRVIECSKDKNMMVFEIRKVLVVTPKDTDLIQQYGLPEDLDGYDFEYVFPEEEGECFSAFKDECTFSVLNYDDLSQGLSPVTGDEFCDVLLDGHMDGIMHVFFEVGPDGFLTSISETYAG